MFSQLGAVLQQVATSLGSGPIPLAVAGIAIIIVGLSWAVMGWMQARTAAAVIIGIAVVGSYSTIASALVH
jgi:hypothetical protein